MWLAAHIWEIRSEYKISVENLKGTHKRRWEDNIKMDLKYCVGMYIGFIYFSMDQWWAFVNPVVNP